MDCTVGDGFRVISSSRANSLALPLESWRRERDTTAQALRVAGGNLHNHNLKLRHHCHVWGSGSIQAQLEVAATTSKNSESSSSLYCNLRLISFEVASWGIPSLLIASACMAIQEAATLTTISNPTPNIYVYVELTQTQLIFNPRPR